LLPLIRQQLKAQPKTYRPVRHRSLAAEELIAELTSACLCAQFGIDGELRYVDYIADCVELLKHDERAKCTAAAKVQQAAYYLRSFSESLE
jgi:antirestriction protein ArdC